MTTHTLHSLFGLKVIVNDLTVSVKYVGFKDWHVHRCYPFRVQKKWNKRYGYKKMIADSEIIQDTVNGVVYCNSITLKAIKEKCPNDHPHA